MVGKKKVELFLIFVIKGFISFFLKKNNNFFKKKVVLFQKRVYNIVIKERMKKEML